MTCTVRRRRSRRASLHQDMRSAGGARGGPKSASPAVPPAPHAANAADLDDDAYWAQPDMQRKLHRMREIGDKARERAGGAYGTGAYYIATALVELPS